MEQLVATQSRMSRHMQVLKQAALVVDRRDAQWVRYRLNPDMLPGIRKVTSAIFKAAEKQQRVAA
jgi:ArsR family transcriptional regulator